jgi:hypothetical protein
MPKIPLQLPVTSVIGRDGEVANARLVNAYSEQVERDGKAAYVLYGVPGLTRWDQESYTGAERGMMLLDEFHLIAVLGNQVVKFDTSGRGTLIGTMTGSGRVIMAQDRENPRSIGVITSDGLYYLITGGNTVTLQSIGDLPVPSSITYLAGHFLFGIPDGRVFCSAIDDGTSVNAAAFDTANLNPDQNVRCYAYNGYAYVFGTSSVEIWVPDPGLANYPFPFSNTRQTITLGLVSPYSIAELDDGLVWIDDTGIVRYGVSGGSQRISTHTIERDIDALSAADRTSIVGTAYEYHGHKLYTMTSSQWTWSYDLRTQAWHQRKSYGQLNWRVVSGIHFHGKVIFGDQTSGKLYWLNPDDPTEDGNPLEMEVWCGVSHRYPGDMIVDKLSVDIVAGKAPQTGNDADTDPHLLIDYSDDGGRTFEGETAKSLGRIGEYGETVETFGWGWVRQKGRIWRFRSTVQALKGIIQAVLLARPIRG